MSVYIVAPVRDLFSEYPLAVRCSPEQVAGLLFVLRFVPERPDYHEVESALEALDVEREAA